MTLLAICSVVSGCARYYVDFPVEGQLAVIPHESPRVKQIDHTGQFTLGKVAASTDVKIDPENEDALNPVYSIHASLLAALGRRTPQETDKQYILNVYVLQHYIPSTGAHVRTAVFAVLAPIGWRTASLAQTLSVNVEVTDAEGIIYAIFNVHNANGKGIALFDAVAEEIVRILTTTAEREKITLSTKLKHSHMMLPKKH